MIRYARAGERVYGTRTNRKGQIEDYHAATVRHDVFIGELPDFPACLGDWQQEAPPIQRHFIRELQNVYSVGTAPIYTVLGTATVTRIESSTATATITKTSFVDLPEHGGGEAPEFGVPWTGESWWRPFEHEVGGERMSLHYDLRFREPNGTCTWRMDKLEAEGKL